MDLCYVRDSDYFGTIVSFSETVLAVGASGDASGARGVGADPTRNDAPLSGAVYLFAATPDGWTQSAYIKPANTDADDRFGFSLAIEGATLSVGAYSESGSARGINGTGVSNGLPKSGAVYTFR